MLDNLGYGAALTEDELDLAATVLSPTFYAATFDRLAGKSVSQVLRHFLTVGIHEALAPSPLFDPLVYEQRSVLAGYPLHETERPSFLHWLRFGMARRIVPTAMFDEDFYQSDNADVVQAGVFGFVHYLLWGMQESRPPNATYDVAALQTAVGAAFGTSWNLMDAYVQLHGLGPDAAGIAVCLGADPASFDGSRGYSLAWRWRAGAARSPVVDFEHDPLARYFATIDLDSVAALAWAKHVPSSWPNPEDRAALEDAVARVRASPLFDAKFYAVQAGLDQPSKGDPVLDPATHYVLVGEALGLMPSAEFDPAYYAKRYPDVVQSGMTLLLHYGDYGRAERRHAHMPKVSHVNAERFDPGRENVIVVVHESSRTGAPILGWNIVRHLADRYNVFTVLLGGGALTPEFEALSAETYGPFLLTQRDVVDICHGLQPLFDGRRFRYAIVNSSESRRCIEVCALQLVPTVFLLHEFGTYVQPLSELRSAFDWATEIVFPAPTVARSSETVHPALMDRPTRILPQGMSVVPAGEALPKPPPLAALEALSRARADGTFLVIGAGTVQIRKGVDLFLAAAAAVQRAGGSRPIHFLWVGHGYNPTKDMGYSIYLHEQIQRSGLAPHVTFLSEVSDLEPVYALADAFLLSSRLDPLPNVSIDAAYRGIPIICFRDASGTADLMLADPLTAAGVVPHLDAEAAGRVIAHLASDEAARREMSVATTRLAHEIFDMAHYVDQLDALGRAHADAAARRHADAATILADDGFDQDLFLGRQPIMESRALSIARYLALVAVAATATETEPVEPSDDEAVTATPPLRRRRPAPGFDPRPWVTAHPERMPGGEDPYADFIRAGRPAGPWQRPVLRPAEDPAALPLGGLRTVLHAHLTDLPQAISLLDHLSVNVLPCDLWITTDTEGTAVPLHRAIAQHRHGALRVEVGTGDLAPLAARLGEYDVIGHVSALPEQPDTAWRDFQWQALLGGRHAMADRILAAFARSPVLGIVLPAEPYLEEGPCRMVWLRAAVLAELSRESDYAAAADRAGLSVAVAHVPGVLW